MDSDNPSLRGRPMRPRTDAAPIVLCNDVAMSRVPVGEVPRAESSIVIPAHNEEMAIGRLLRSLLESATPGEFDIVVVCNGCTDRTSEIARYFGPDVRVLELESPSKQLALARGDAEARYFPRFYVDADVELSTSGVRAISAVLLRGEVLAGGPERMIDLGSASLLVRAYYAVWTRLPQVRTGLFGRGVVAVSAAGHRRTSLQTAVMSDDLAMSEAFALNERAVVADAVVVIRPPRTIGDLVRRRIRVVAGGVQLDQLGGRSAEAKTSWRDLFLIARERPTLSLCIPIFLGVALTAKIAARRPVRKGDFSTWLRDESSRRAAP
jgi:glycosyltransferase involved in cell wall biosynthesis